MADQAPQDVIYPVWQGSRLAFFRDPELAGAMPRSGGRAWAGARQITPGPTRTFSFYDTPSHELDPEVTRKLQDGTDYTPSIYDVPKPYPTRPARLGSYFVSDPAIFQSYFKTDFSDMFGASAQLKEGSRRLSQIPNRQAMGKAEGQAITDYNPWPSQSQLAPTYPGAELKAI